MWNRLYPEYWSKEQINLAKKLLDVIKESDLSCADAGTVLDGLSEHMLMIIRRASELFSAKETLPRVEKRIQQDYR